MSQSCNSLKTTTLPPSFDRDDPPDYSIMPNGETPSTDTGSDSVGTAWYESPCNPKARYRYADSGYVEIEGEGIVRSNAWPSEVDDWRSLIEQAADANGISRALLAAIVAMESKGKPNTKSESGRLGLTQLDPQVAQEISGSSNDLPDAMILNPSWNLMHGARLIAALVDASDDMNLVWALAGYNNRDVRDYRKEAYEYGGAGAAWCEVNTDCAKLDRWGMWTDCGYIDNVIALINTAIDNGYQGPRQIDLGSDGKKAKKAKKSGNGSIWPYAFWLGVGAAITAAVVSTKKKG